MIFQLRVISKEKPAVVEIGPYTYQYVAFEKIFWLFCKYELFSQQWIKENLQWHENGTITYSLRKEFTFQPRLSVGDHRLDNLTILNVPAISAIHKVRNQSFFSKYATRLRVVLFLCKYTNWIVEFYIMKHVFTISGYQQNYGSTKLLSNWFGDILNPL